MLVLVLVGLVAGVITSLSPCVLPVLPVVLTASVPSHTVAASSGATEHDDTGRRERSRRPYGVVAGLMLSFSVATLFGSPLLSALHLPGNLLRVVGIAVLVVIGVSFIWRPFGELLERPFTRLAGRPVNPNSNGLILGMRLGLLYVSCAGPVLTVISVVGASHQFSAGALVLTGTFAVGVGLPLLALALTGESLGSLTPQCRGGLKVNPHGGSGCSEANPAPVGKAPEPRPERCIWWPVGRATSG